MESEAVSIFTLPKNYLHNSQKTNIGFFFVKYNVIYIFFKRKSKKLIEQPL